MTIHGQHGGQQGSSAWSSAFSAAMGDGIVPRTATVSTTHGTEKRGIRWPWTRTRSTVADEAVPHV